MQARNLACNESLSGYHTQTAGGPRTTIRQNLAPGTKSITHWFLKAVENRQKYVLVGDGLSLDTYGLKNSMEIWPVKWAPVPQVGRKWRDKENTTLGSYVLKLPVTYIYACTGKSLYGRGPEIWTTVKDLRPRELGYKAVRKWVMSITQAKPYPAQQGKYDLPAAVENIKSPSGDIYLRSMRIWPQSKWRKLLGVHVGWVQVQQKLLCMRKCWQKLLS